MTAALRPLWRNRYTRWSQKPLPRGMWVRIPPGAPGRAWVLIRWFLAASRSPAGCGTLQRVTGHMSAGDFRRHGYAVIDWIADYYERVESFPGLSPAPPGRDPRCAAGPSARAGRAVRAGSARSRRDDPAGHHTLAAPVLLRLLPGEHQRP